MRPTYASGQSNQQHYLDEHQGYYGHASSQPPTPSGMPTTSAYGMSHMAAAPYGMMPMVPYPMMSDGPMSSSDPYAMGQVMQAQQAGYGYADPSAMMAMQLQQQQLQHAGYVDPSIMMTMQQQQQLQQAGYGYVDPASSMVVPAAMHYNHARAVQAQSARIQQTTRQAYLGAAGTAPYAGARRTALTIKPPPSSAPRSASAAASAGSAPGGGTPGSAPAAGSAGASPGGGGADPATPSGVGPSLGQASPRTTVSPSSSKAPPEPSASAVPPSKALPPSFYPASKVPQQPIPPPDPKARPVGSGAAAHHAHQPPPSTSGWAEGGDAFGGYSGNEGLNQGSSYQDTGAAWGDEWQGEAGMEAYHSSELGGGWQGEENWYSGQAGTESSHQQPGGGRESRALTISAPRPPQSSLPQKPPPPPHSPSWSSGVGGSSSLGSLAGAAQLPVLTGTRAMEEQLMSSAMVEYMVRWAVQGHMCVCVGGGGGGTWSGGRYIYHMGHLGQYMVRWVGQ